MVLWHIQIVQLLLYIISNESDASIHYMYYSTNNYTKDESLNIYYCAISSDTIPIQIIVNLKEGYDDIVLTILRTNAFVDVELQTIKLFCYRLDKSTNIFNNVRLGFYCCYINYNSI